MKRPGRWLRTIASDICSANTMERIVDPIISDLQTDTLPAFVIGWLPNLVVVAAADLFKVTPRALT